LGERADPRPKLLFFPDHAKIAANFLEFVLPVSAESPNEHLLFFALASPSPGVKNQMDGDVPHSAHKFPDFLAAPNSKNLQN
jgi:hypothetical protein